jgi:hypothetical protein
LLFARDPDTFQVALLLDRRFVDVIDDDHGEGSSGLTSLRLSSF